VRLDFAYATRTVLYAMAVFMAVATIVAFVGLRSELQQEAEATEAEEALA
jgi:type VI protein secretion system component VasF